MTTLIIDHALTDTITHINDHVIIFLAFSTFASSPPEIRYIIHPTMTESTEITATYLIDSAINLHKNEKKSLLEILFWVSQVVLASHHGSQLQTTSGDDAHTSNHKKRKQRQSVIILSIIYYL